MDTGIGRRGGWWYRLRAPYGRRWHSRLKGRRGIAGSSRCQRRVRVRLEVEVGIWVWVRIGVGNGRRKQMRHKLASNNMEEFIEDSRLVLFRFNVAMKSRDVDE